MSALSYGIVRGLVAGVASLVIATMPIAAQAAAGDTVTTEKKVLSQLLIESAQTGVFYYVQTAGGWGLSNCSGALYAYISQSAPGADAILSAMLTARSTGTQIGFGGICGDVNGDTRYIQIRTAYL